MSFSVSIANREQILVPTTKRLAILGVSSGGDLGAPYQFTSGADVVGTIAYGPSSALIRNILAEAPGVEVIYQKITGGVAGTIGSVTETPSGSGPTITVSGAPYDTFDVKVKVTKAGPCGTAVVRVALDGATYGDDVPVPAELPASVTGTVDLTTITLSDLNTLTHIGTSDIGGPITTTFTTPTSVQNIADQITAAYAAGTDEAAARIVSGKYLQIYSLTNGPSSTFSLGAGTAHTLLGLSGGPFAGSASTYSPPGTGFTLTFPSSSDYVLDTVYSFATVQPRFSVSASTTAFDTLREWAKITSEIPETLSCCFLLVDPVDGTDVRTFADALSSRRGEYHTDKIFCSFEMGTSLHTASSTLSTNQSNITTSDAAIKAAMAGFVDAYIAVDVDDCYVTEATGKMRRHLVHWIALFHARERISADPGNRSLLGFSIVDTRAADGLTLARNENTATHKMRADRFTAAKREGANSYIERGVTRANPGITPKFKHRGIVQAALLTARALVPFARRYENTDPFLAPDGTLLPEEADAIEGGGTDIVVRALVNEAHLSAGVVTVNRSENISSTENLTITATVQHKGQILNVALNIGVVGTLPVISVT